MHRLVAHELIDTFAFAPGEEPPARVEIRRRRWA
jgi:hypothetical protein